MVQRKIILVISISALWPASAGAQGFVQGTRSEPFVPIATIPGIQNVATLTFSNANDGQATVTALPFAFNFLGTPFTRANLGTNGVLTLGSESAVTASNQAPGTTSAPHNWIAPLWDDLVHPVTANARWGTIGTAPSRIVVFEAGPATRAPGTGGTLYYQVWLFEGDPGRFEFRSTGSAVNALSATIGYEGASGVFSLNSGVCMPATGCAAVPEGTTFFTERARDPDLTGTLTGLPRGALPGQTVNAQLSLQNLGIDTATGALCTAYLSTDNLLDAGDIIVGTAGPIDVPGNGAPVITPMPLTVPGMTAIVDFFLLLHVDSAEDWAEPSETNNLVVVQRFATAPDFAVTRVLPRGSGAYPGQTAIFDLTVTNDGVPFSGVLPVRFYLSANRTFEITDALVGDASPSVTSASQVVPVTLTLPMIAPGRYYPIAVVDPDGALTELDESNNVFAGTQVVVGADFTIARLTAPTQVQPGQSIAISTRVDSTGAPYVGQVSYDLVASANTTFEMSDFSLGSYTVDFNNSDFIDDNRTVTFPQAMAPGRYYVIAKADAASVIAEVDEANNARATSASIVNAFDLAAGTTLSFTPASATTSSTLTVTSAIRSLGLTFTGTVTYRIHLSLDSRLDASDVSVFESAVHLTGAASTPLVTAFLFPRNVPVGTYRVILSVDPLDAIVEADEANNAVSSGASLLVDGPDLRVVSMTGTSTAFAGQPYLVRLSLENIGGFAATSFTYSYFVSTNEFIRITDTRVHVSTSTTLAARTSASFADEIMLPAVTSTTGFFVGVIVNEEFDSPDASVANNIGRIPHRVYMVQEVPDLQVARLVVPTATIAAGDAFTAQREIVNAGAADAVGFQYTYYLSRNATITANDRPIGTFTRTLNGRSRDDNADDLVIPSDVPPGSYHFGIIVDPAEQIAEYDETNNIARGPSARITRPMVRIVTEVLPNAKLGQTYELRLLADGGQNPIAWSVANGALPAGLTLDAGGTITGTPSMVGLASFAVRATSGASVDQRAYELRVAAANELAIIASVLPTGQVEQPYEATLTAEGGVPPYRWSLGAGDMLPMGLALAEDGRVTGTPTHAGPHRFTVNVSDSAALVDSRRFSISIDDVPPSPPAVEKSCGCAALRAPERSRASVFLTIAAFVVLGFRTKLRRPERRK